MKFISAAFIALVAQPCLSFAPPSSKVAFGVSQHEKNAITSLNMAEGPQIPFFANSPAAEKKEEGEEQSEDEMLDSMSADEEVEFQVKEEMRKGRIVSNLRNANGVDYAPWMNISADDEAKIRQVMKERTEARRKRREQEKSVSGNLYYDSQAQELSGAGLSNKVIDGEVELEWGTKTETNTKGFIVKRRAAKTEQFEVIASYENWGPLASKGPDGGIYRYLDTTVSPGGWVYRISECDNNGNEADLCQCLVEVQTEDEQRAALIAGVGIAVFGVAAVVAGLVLDPYAG